MLHTSRLLSYAHAIQANQGKRTLLEPQATQLGLDGEESARVLDTLHTLGVAEGWQLAGRKMILGEPRAANESVQLPSLGYLYQHSLMHAEDNTTALKLRSAKPLFVEPTLVFGLGSTPEPGEGLHSFLQRFDSVALAIEILQNPFKAERWVDADKVCANGFHSRLVMGEAKTLSQKSRTVFDDLVSNATMTLNVVERDGSRIVGFARGSDRLNKSLQHAYALHQRQIELTRESPFVAGHYLAIGGWLPSKAIGSGQEWVTVVSGIDLPSLRVTIE
jgi:2-keto-4-pentenoate hydratase